MRNWPCIAPLLLMTFVCGASAGESILEDCAREDTQCLQRNYGKACVGDAANGDACLGLASSAPDSAERLRILRRVADLSPTPHSLHILARELGNTGRQEDTLEAAHLMERAFSMTSNQWWYAARSAYLLYLEAGEARLAARLRERAQQILPAKPLRRLSASVTADDVHDVLEQLCSHDALPVLGPAHCLNSIRAVVEHVAAANNGDRSQDIADVAASAMLAATANQRTLDEEAPEWRKQYQAWIDSLIASGRDSVAVRRLRAHAEEDSWPIVVE